MKLFRIERSVEKDIDGLVSAQSYEIGKSLVLIKDGIFLPAVYFLQNGKYAKIL